MPHPGLTAGYNWSRVTMTPAMHPHAANAAGQDDASETAFYTAAGWNHDPFLIGVLLLVISNLACAHTNAAGIQYVKQFKQICEYPPLAQMYGAASTAMSSYSRAPLAKRRASLLAGAVPAVCPWPAAGMSDEMRADPCKCMTRLMVDAGDKLLVLSLVKAACMICMDLCNYVLSNNQLI